MHVINPVATKRQRCFDKRSMTFYNLPFSPKFPRYGIG